MRAHHGDARHTTTVADAVQDFTGKVHKSQSRIHRDIRHATTRHHGVGAERRRGSGRCRTERPWR